MKKQSAQNQTPWTNGQAYGLAVITLILGICIGWFLKSSASEAPATATTSAPSASLPSTPAAPDVDAGASALLAQLQTRPNDPALLGSVGNYYYDNQAYTKAIEFYQRALAVRPEDPDLRTDMGTAMWYSGDADGALREFATSLKYNPTHNHTLFNRGVVLLQGKHDAKAAVASWRELLKVNPNYSDRAKVESMIAQAER